MLRFLFAAAFVIAVGDACTIFDAASIPCDKDADCAGGQVCTSGFCANAGDPLHNVAEGEGEGANVGGEGEGANVGEGEGVVGEGEGGVVGEGEGEGSTAISLCPEGPAVEPPAWFDVNSHHREALAFCDAGAPDEDVTNLPVSVILTPDIFDFTSALPDGSDIFFVDGRTNQPLPFEKAQYLPNDPGGAFAAFFVRVPAFNPHRGADAIWMYWANTAPTHSSNAATTFLGYAQVWHMDGAPNNGDFVGNNTLIVDTITGQTVKNALASSFNDNDLQKAFVFGTEGPLGNALVFDAGGVGCTSCRADSFVVLPPPPNVTSSSGSISLVVGAISETDPNNANNTKTGVGGSGCADGSGDCGHLWLLGELQTSSGFDNKSIHVSSFGGGKVGVSRPSNPSTAGHFSASSTTSVIDQQKFSVVSTTWTSAEIDTTVTTVSADGQSVVQSTITSARAVVPFTISNFLLGISENPNTFNQAGDLFGMIEEVRVSSTAFDAAYVRAEAASHLDELFIFGPDEPGP